MKLTIENVLSMYPEVQDRLPEKLTAEWGNVTKMHKFYHKSEKIKDVLDLWLQLANEALKDDDSESKPKKEPKAPKAPKVPKQPKLKAKFKVGDKVVTEHSDDVYAIAEVEVGTYSVKYKLDTISGWWSESQLTKAKAQKKPKAAKAPKAPKAPKPTPTYYHTETPEVKIIRRYAALNNKPFNGKNKDEARKTLSALQKAIVEQQIRKTSPFAAEIMAIQDDLIKMMSLRASGAVISIPEVDKYKAIAGKSAVSPAVVLLKRFVALVGKDGVKDKAKKLKTALEVITDDIHKFMISSAIDSLSKYIDGKDDVVSASSAVLEGLYGLCGITPERSRKHSATAAELANTYFDCIRMSGKWEKIIGRPNTPFKIMIYGAPGSGKSTLALQHAGYLARDHSHKVLYVAAEEGLSYTMQEKLERLGIKSGNLTIVDELPSAKELAKYDTIFIDSVNNAGLEASDLRKLPKDKNYVYVMQTTKDGRFRGSQEYLHDVDTCVRVENMTAYTEKNRFGAQGTCGVLDRC